MEFTKAEKRATRLKLFIFGETGTGKTVTALHFPSVAMIDTEKGTDHYGEFFEFHRIQSSDPKVILETIESLLKEPGDFRTLVIDPFTNINDRIEEDLLRKLRAKSGDPDQELLPKDYKYIKKAVKHIIKKLLALDMNIIVTSQSKALYSTDNQEFMKLLGSQPDSPKQLPYMFDVYIELKKEDEKYIAYVKKDRTNKLPPKFEFNYDSFSKYLGIEGLERKAVQFHQQVEGDARMERTHEVTFDGKKIKTAGITAENLAALKEIFIASPEKKDELLKQFMVESPLDLRNDEADMFIKNHNKINLEWDENEN